MQLLSLVLLTHGVAILEGFGPCHWTYEWCDYMLLQEQCLVMHMLVLAR